MEVKVHYDNLAKRNEAIVVYEARGYRMLHDDFDTIWKAGDEPHGTMTFTDVMPPVSPVEPIRDLAAEIDQMKIDIQAIKTKAGIA